MRERLTSALHGRPWRWALLALLIAAVPAAAWLGRDRLAESKPTKLAASENSHTAPGDESSRQDEEGEKAEKEHEEEGENDEGRANEEGSASKASARPPRGAFVSSLKTSRAVLWAVGDGADGGPAAKALVQRITSRRVDRFLYLGDVYDWGTAAEFAQRYGSVYRRLDRRTAPTPGNHDTPTSDGYDPYWKRVTGRQPPSFYSFSAAGWQILSLNSEAAHGPGSAQLRWLRSQLRRPGTCRIAFWHRPRFSAGTEHGDQADMEPVWNALRGRARIVLSGHEHDMQRLYPLDGLVELVSGAGGHSHYKLDRSYRRLGFGNDTAWGALRLELRPGVSEFAFVTTGGRTLDSGTIPCRR